jgi:hypothetical protein
MAKCSRIEAGFLGRGVESQSRVMGAVLDEVGLGCAKILPSASASRPRSLVWRDAIYLHRIAETAYCDA